jgi:hypothetical protein
MKSKFVKITKQTLQVNKKTYIRVDIKMDIREDEKLKGKKSWEKT